MLPAACHLRPDAPLSLSWLAAICHLFASGIIPSVKAFNYELLLTYEGSLAWHQHAGACPCLTARSPQLSKCDAPSRAAGGCLGASSLVHHPDAPAHL